MYTTDGRNPSTGNVLIIAHRRESTQRHNILHGSAKPPTSTGESQYYLKIKKGYKINTWRRITSTKLPAQPHSGQQLLFLSSSLLHSRFLFSPLALFACLFYRQMDELSSLINSSCTWDFIICQCATTIDKW